MREIEKERARIWKRGAAVFDCRLLSWRGLLLSTAPVLQQDPLIKPYTQALLLPGVFELHIQDSSASVEKRREVVLRCLIEYMGKRQEDLISGTTVVTQLCSETLKLRLSEKEASQPRNLKKSLEGGPSALGQCFASEFQSFRAELRDNPATNHVSRKLATVWAYLRKVVHTDIVFRAVCVCEGEFVCPAVHVFRRLLYHGRRIKALYQSRVTEAGKLS
ncbi:unnamed protein product [Leuciscus chuanchicus]